MRESPTDFYETHLPLVYAYFVRRTDDVPTAEDLTAETFERIATAWSDFEPRGDAAMATRVWVYRIAGNVLKNALRSSARREVYHRAWFAEQRGHDDPGATVEYRLMLDQALGALPPEDRDLLGLRFWEGLSGPEIASVLDLSPREVYTRVERCLRTLKRELGVEREVNYVGY